MAVLRRRRLLAAGVASFASMPRSYGKNATNTRPRVVIVGGGAGGATIARLIARNKAVDVVLVEANKYYQSCFFSNHFIGGLRPISSLIHSFEPLGQRDGIRVVHDRVIDIDRVGKQIKLSKQTGLHFDILILAPGIDFIEGSVPGWHLSDSDRMPHAYSGGQQVQRLKQQLDSLPKGGVFAMIVPAGKYRCPPGPYERACVVAHRLKTVNPSAKIIIIDPKPVFSKMGLFREAWKKHYSGMIDMNSDVNMSELEVDPRAMTIKLGSETIKVDVCNVIPAQQAGFITRLAGIAQLGWAPVHARDMRSTMDENIYVIGDAAEQGDMPKSAFAANSQAKVCASHILGRLTGSSVNLASYANTCWSWVAENNSVKIGATYEAAEDKISRVEGFTSKRREDSATRQATYHESLGWYDAMVSDMFGPSR